MKKLLNTKVKPHQFIMNLSMSQNNKIFKLNKFLKILSLHQKLLFILKIAIKLQDQNIQLMVKAEKQKELPILGKLRLKYGKIWSLAILKKEC
jgi:hypothetical protein